MEAEIFINTTTKVARSSVDGVGTPRVPIILQSHLRLTAYFFATGEDPALLNGSTSFRVALKDYTTPSGSVLALLSAPTATGADYYEFEWAQLDSTALRTLCGDSTDPVAAMLEIEWTLSAVVERVQIPVTITNAWLRTADAAPDFQPFEASITAAGYLRLVNTNGDVFHIGLNTGEPPT